MCGSFQKTKRCLVCLCTLALFGFSLTNSLHAKTFRWAFQGDAQTLDPHAINETFTLSFLSNIYEGLVRRAPDLSLQPALAERWEVISPTQWRFFLRKSITFHNGNAFNADDVLFNIERTRSEGSDMKARVNSIKKAVKIDDYTVDIFTDKPNPILISEWHDWLMMDKEWCEANKAVEATNIKSGTENFSTRHVNGTGPFMLVKRERDMKTSLKPNPNWWDQPKHNLTEVVFTPINSPSTRVAALISGEVDMVYPVPVQDINRLNSGATTSVLVGPETRTIFLGFNQTVDELPCCNIKGQNPFKNPLVRKAVYQAINVKIIKKKIMRGLSEPSALMLSPNMFAAHAEEFERHPYNPKDAKDLLAKAGYPNGFSFCMDCPNNRYVNDESICQAVVSMLAKIGIKVTLKAQPKAQYFKKVLSYDTEFYLLGWSPSSSDSYNILYNLIHSRKDGRGKFNLGGYSNNRIDTLTDMILVEMVPEKRNFMIREAFQILHNEIGYIPLHQQGLAWGVNKRVSLVQKADNTLDLNYVTIK